jgi:trimeric autotransporter adhesin
MPEHFFNYHPRKSRQIGFEKLESRFALVGEVELVADFSINEPLLDNLTVVNDSLFYIARGNTGADGLWATNTKSELTEQVLRFTVDEQAAIVSMQNVNGTLFFITYSTHNGSSLWKSDGTERGTLLLNHISEPGITSPRDLTEVNGTLYFIANEGKFQDDTWVSGFELWKSDGTKESTVMLRKHTKCQR